MIFFGILRIKLNFSFPLFHFPVHLYEKKLVISPASKPEVEENIDVSISVFLWLFIGQKSERRKNYRYTKAKLKITKMSCVSRVRSRKLKKTV